MFVVLIVERFVYCDQNKFLTKFNVSTRMLFSSSKITCPLRGRGVGRNPCCILLPEFIEQEAERWGQILLSTAENNGPRTRFFSQLIHPKIIQTVHGEVLNTFYTNKTCEIFRPKITLPFFICNTFVHRQSQYL